MSLSTTERTVPIAMDKGSIWLTVVSVAGSIASIVALYLLAFANHPVLTAASGGVLGAAIVGFVWYWWFARPKASKLAATVVSLEQARNCALAAGDASANLFHETAHVTRLAVCNKVSASELKSIVHTILEQTLPAYINLLTGRESAIRVTIKVIDEGTKRLRARYRDSRQLRECKARSEGEYEDLDGHYFYARIHNKEHWSDNRRCLVVHDTERCDDSVLRDRAKARGYRTTLAIPLNAHRILGETSRVEWFFGFLGIDCPDQGAFQTLFEPTDDTAKDLPNDGAGSTPRASMEAVFALADCISIVVWTIDNIAFPDDRDHQEQPTTGAITP